MPVYLRSFPRWIIAIGVLGILAAIVGVDQVSDASFPASLAPVAAPLAQQRSSAAGHYLPVPLARGMKILPVPLAHGQTVRLLVGGQASVASSLSRLPQP